jgi:hypothetical protein
VNELGLFVAEGEAVTAKPEFNRIAKRCTTNDFDLRAVAESHLQKTTTQIGIAAHGNHGAATSNAQAIQSTRFKGTSVVATRSLTDGLGHEDSSPRDAQILMSLRLSFNKRMEIGR